jgi:ribosomal protein L11 methyltransferase
MLSALLKYGQYTAMTSQDRYRISLKNGAVLQIEPAGVFGSGQHPTTRLCIKMIERYLKKGDSLLDIGTGSGILMIAAAKLGAALVWGTDNNKAAVAAARKNLRMNAIEQSRYAVSTGNLAVGVTRQFDIVVANILPEIIVTILEDVHAVLKQKGILICSGMIQANTHRVVAKMKARGMKVVDTCTQSQWAAIVGKLQSAMGEIRNGLETGENP